MKKNKNGMMAHLFSQSKKERAFLIGSIFLSTCGMLCNVIPYVSVYFIGRIFLMGGSKDQEAAFVWVGISAGAIILNLIFTFLGGLGCHTIAFKILYRYRLLLMEHLGKLPIGFFEKHTSGSIQKIMDENMEKLELVIAHILPDFIGSFIVLISLFVGISYLSWAMALMIVVSVVIAFFFQYRVFGGEKAKERYVSYMESASQITSAFSEYVNGISEIKLFGKTGQMTKALDLYLHECLEWEITNYKNSAFYMSLYKSIILSLLTFVLPVGGFLLLKNPTGDMVLSILMVLILAPALYEPLLTCIDYATQINFTRAGLHQIDEILNTPIFSVKEKTGKNQGFAIRFDQVSFSYQEDQDPSKTWALDDISFVCEKNQMTALVGESGSGKSTIGQLLLRFWDVTKGEITIGGKDIREFESKELMEIIAFVLQDTHIFSDTVRNNITMNRDYSDDEIIAVAKKAQCHDFIMNLEKGYDTMLGSGNLTLSGGEKQRISIARAFLKDSKIILLDEALAYTDAENENKIQEAIKMLVRDKTVLVIAHRLKSIMDADRIIVLKEGKIIEEGTHEQLIQNNSEYNMLWDLQSEAENWALGGNHQ